LLKFLRVREFAPEAAFTDSCETFVLPGVLCHYCCYLRDMYVAARASPLDAALNWLVGWVVRDLLRDADLLPGSAWMCPVCDHPYDKRKIECMLLEIIAKRNLRYQVHCLRLLLQ
jgi:DNA polymerase epsilon subunit 1